MIINARDSDLIDRTTRPELVKKVIKSPTLVQIKEASTDKPDNYIPKSMICLTAYRQALLRWKPVLKRLSEGHSPDSTDYQNTLSLGLVGIPKEISDLMEEDIGGYVGAGTHEYQQLKTLQSLLGKILTMKAKSGSYPQKPKRCDRS